MSQLIGFENPSQLAEADVPPAPNAISCGSEAERSRRMNATSERFLCDCWPGRLVIGVAVLVLLLTGCNRAHYRARPIKTPTR